MMELPQWGGTFSGFWGSESSDRWGYKCEDFYFIKFNKVSIYFSSELYLTN